MSIMDTVRCVQCRKPFTQEDPLQTACSRACVRAFVIRWSGRRPVGDLEYPRQMKDPRGPEGDDALSREASHFTPGA